MISPTGDPTGAQHTGAPMRTRRRPALPPRPLAALLGAIAALILAGVVGTTRSAPDVGHTTLVRPPAAVVQATPSPVPAAQPVQDTDAFPVYTARDPFEQLVAADTGGDGTTPADGTAPADPAGTDSTGSDPAGTDASGTGTIPDIGGTAGSGPADTTQVPPGPAPSPSPGATASGQGGRAIELVDVYTAPDGEPAAIITVNGNGYTPSVGDAFAGEMMLVSVDGQCVALRVDGGAVGLCEGDVVRK